MQLPTIQSGTIDKSMSTFKLDASILAQTLIQQSVVVTVQFDRNTVFQPSYFWRRIPVNLTDHNGITAFLYRFNLRMMDDFGETSRHVFV